MVVELWHRVSNIGIGGLPLEERRKLRALNQFILIASVSLFAYGALLLVFEPQLLHVAALDFVVGALQLTGYWHVKAERRVLAAGQFLFLCNAQLAAAAHFTGPDFGYHYYFFAFVSVVFLVSPRKHWFHYPWVVVSSACFIYFSQAPQHVVSEHAWWFRLNIIMATCGTLALVAFLFDDDAREAEHDLEVEHKRSEALLLNVLPASISERLKDGDQSIADGFAEVSVVFADLVGFTQLSQQLDPAELVHLLNRVFSRFDELADRLGVEKIKTIGDAYMAAAGLPEPNKDHAAIATRMALGMRDVVVELNAMEGFELGVRIGVNSGPVVAGVIGKKKFIYDLWGDTVNTASRMESHGVAGSVHVTQETAKRIEGSFYVEERGTMEVKGKGPMTTYVVHGPKAA